MVVLGGNRFTLGVVQGIDNMRDIHGARLHYWLNLQDIISAQRKDFLSASRPTTGKI